MDNLNELAPEVAEEAKVEAEVSRRPKTVQFPPQFDWGLEGFSEEEALRNFSKLADEDLKTALSHEHQEKLHIADSAVKGSGMSKSNVYILRGEDQSYGAIEIVRKYSDFYELREALVRRWPGLFIPPIPEKGNIGANEKQIAKNKLQILNNFLRRTVPREAIFRGEEFQIFIKSPESDVNKNLQKLKPRSIEDLLSTYKLIWPEFFVEKSDEEIKSEEKRIKDFEDYFMVAKVDLVRHKDQMKRLAELRGKLNAQRYQILSKTLPQYEALCLNWFKKTDGPVATQQKSSKPQEEQNVEPKEEEQPEKQANQEGRIYSSEKYQNLLEAYKEDLFQDKSDEGWTMYELFKFQIREIESILQAVTHYKYLINDKKFYTRNVENNKQQIEDINNKKISLKIFFLSGSEDDKKSQLANETIEFENKLRVIEELWNAATLLMVSEIEEFQIERCDHYKKSLMNSFKREALIMSKLFNLYVEAQRL